MEVSLLDRLPCRYKNDCYIRIGTTTRRATFDEELKLYERTRRRGTTQPFLDKLPPREAIKFVGRRRELSELWEWFRDPREWRRVLAGDGGKGKTAIAYEFACRIADARPEEYDVVLWASAKKRQFKQGEITPVTAPDFFDLDSFLNKIFADIGFPEEQSLDLNSKRDKVIEIFNTFPALLVVDDLDSLDWENNQDVMDFITFHVPHTKCKLLVTSRRMVPSLPTTYVTGFNEDEGQEFIKSRFRMAGIDPDLLNPRQMRAMLRATDSSPLYIIGLLGAFMALGDLEAAIEIWTDRGGDEAREYALRRELELLSDDARFVLASFAVLDGPASSAEAKAITGFSYSKLENAIHELQRLFLVPRPSIAEGLPRFSVNSNTKTMVLHVMEGSQELKKAKSAVRSMTGAVYRDSRRRTAISSYIMQATGLIRNKSYVEAEKTIKKGLEQFSQDPELNGALGWVYKSWSPRRTTDAREHFQRSAELKCQNGETYKHWYEMEEQEKNWGGAVEAARATLDIFKNNSLWTFRYGYALSRYGQHLASQLQPRAIANLGRADKILNGFLQSKQIPAESEYQDLHWKACRALVLNASSLYKLSTNEEDKDKWLTRLAQVLLIWRTEYSEDQLTDFEVQKLMNWHPEVRTKLKELSDNTKDTA